MLTCDSASAKTSATKERAWTTHCGRRELSKVETCYRDMSVSPIDRLEARIPACWARSKSRDTDVRRCCRVLGEFHIEAS